MAEAEPNDLDRTSPFKLADTEFIGKYQHVIRLNYPCGNIEDVKGPHGQPPTLTIIASVLARHKKECEYGCE